MFDSPQAIASLMSDFEKRWFIAGGWAIDLFLDKETRPHGDIEIAVFRDDQICLQNYLEKWTLKTAVNGRLKAWKKHEFLRLPLHEIHCFDQSGESFLEVLFNEAKNGEWIFRRNAKITKPISESFSISKTGIKFLRPEIVLLYKSKNPRAKDEQDFQAAVNFLDIENKEWLKNALSICYPQKHRWLENL